ncbi:MAG: hypothetical protein AUI14_12170 [Actinobacteria bacterium 13_2_20CM_2_71_6]|nr:MAG: hypothetical protein AUI14_12170 [Actinobacteria bacterium 13_2_20CM_2_71_6]
MPVGCASYWDRCYRCTRRGLLGRPYQPEIRTEGTDFDPWHERIVEVLDAVELAGAGWSA